MKSLKKELKGSHNFIIINLSQWIWETVWNLYFRVNKIVIIISSFFEENEKKFLFYFSSLRTLLTNFTNYIYSIASLNNFIIRLKNFVTSNAFAWILTISVSFSSNNYVPQLLTTRINFFPVFTITFSFFSDTPSL